MSDKIKNNVINSVTITGRIAEIEVKQDKTKKNIPYVSIKGAIQFGDSKAQIRRFEAFQQSITTKGKENKLYASTLEFAEKAKSIAQVGNDEATVVSIQGEFQTNDYVNVKEMLVEGLNIKATFFNDVAPDVEFKATADIEGYIQSIEEETKGENQEETGRLKVNLLTTDFSGNIIPIKNLIVPAELKESFESGYEVGQTATLFIDFVVNKTDEKPVPTGGIGVQRSTGGKSFVEMQITGANPPFEEDDEFGISEEAIRIALVDRKAQLDEIKAEGYKGSKGSSQPQANRNGFAGKTKPKSVEDDDMPF